MAFDPNRFGGTKGNTGRNRIDYAREVGDALYQAMNAVRPRISQFYGVPGFPPNELRSDNRLVQKRTQKIEEDEWNNSSAFIPDEWAQFAEPVVAYYLNDEKLFANANNYAFPASHFDDLFRGTDVVFGIQEKDGEKDGVFSIDASTGTGRDSVDKKFRVSIDEHRGVSDVKYCLHDEKKWSEEEAPHFVVGMSPASIQKALLTFHLENGVLKGHDEDLDTKFIIVSELHRQVCMQLKLLGKKPEDSTSPLAQRIQKLTELKKPLSLSLKKMFGFPVNGKLSPDVLRKMNDEYLRMVKKMGAFDSVYNNIMQESLDRLSNNRGDLIGNKKL